MADLAKFQQETLAAYQPAISSIQTQQAGLDKKLASTTADIDKQYNRQIGNINRAANDAAYAASIAAAGNGGSFGGSGEIAREKYYNQSFVPAMQQAVYGKNDAYKSAQEARDTSYENLASQLAQLQAEANKYALQRYDAAVEAERQAAEAERNRQAQLAASRSQANALSYMNQGGGNSGGKSRYSYRNGAWYDNTTNKAVKAGTVAQYATSNGGVSYNDALRDVLLIQANAGDSRSKTALKALDKGIKFVYNGGNSYRYTGDDIFENLGIYSDDSRLRRK